MNNTRRKPGSLAKFITKEQMEEAVAHANSLYDVIEFLGFAHTESSREGIIQRSMELGINLPTA